MIILSGGRSGTNEAAVLFLGKTSRFFKDLHEHHAGKFASLRVLIRGMIRSQQRAPIGYFVLCAMLEQKRPSAPDDAELFEMTQVSVECNLPQRHYYFRLFQTVKLPVKVRRAIGQLSRQRLVVGRRA